MHLLTLITPTRNSDKTLTQCLNSVLIQKYKKIQHIFVDTNSTDNTLELIDKYPIKNKILIKQSKRGIYQALNSGLKKATGDLIGILHSDDMLFNKNTLLNLVTIVKKKPDIDIFLGDVIYFSNSPQKITRKYSAGKFSPNLLKYGVMPPHTGSFIRKKIYKSEKYDTKYKIAGDFDFFIKTLYIKSISYFNLNFVTTKMKTGGVSGKNLITYLSTTKELIRIFSKYHFKNKIFRAAIRFPIKLDQFFFYEKKKYITKHTITSFYKENYPYQFKIIKKFASLTFKKNYILSALNLAFLGYFSKGMISNNKNYILWPDGIFSKFIGFRVKKNPGRNLFENKKIFKHCKEILVLGNLSKKSKSFIISKINKNILHIELPYGTTKKIINFIENKKITIKSNQIVFLTLPTPKQEQIAEYLSTKFKKYRIICIGASIAIASREEEPVPEQLSNFEFLWRLRYETKRRLKRLLETYYYFLKDKFVTKKIDLIELKIAK